MKILLIFWSLWFLNFSSRTILSPLLPIFEKQLGISHALSGSTFLSLAVGYTCSLVVAGWITPRIGYKRSIVGGFFLLTLALAALVLVKAYGHLIAVAFFLGLGAGIYLPCALPVLTSSISPDKWGKAIAFHETAASFSILAAPLLVAAALALTGWKALVLALCVLCLAVTLVFMVRLQEPPQQGKGKRTFSLVFRRREFWVISAVWSFAAAGGLGLYNLIPLFLVNEKGLTLDMANTLFGFSRVSGLVLIFLSGLFMDKFGVKLVLFTSLLASGLATVGLAVAESFPFLIGMLVMQATFIPVFFPAALVAVSKLTDISDRSAFAGATVAIAVVFGTGVAPSLVGILADFHGFAAGFFWQGALTVLVCPLIAFLRKI